MKITKYFFTFLFFFAFNFCSAQLQDSITNLCNNINTDILSNCQSCQRYLNAGFEKANNADHVGAIYEYTLAYNSDFPAANQLIYSLINNSAKDLEKLKKQAEYNAKELEKLNNELNLQKDVLIAQNKTIARQRDSIKDNLVEIYKKGKIAEFLRIPILADSILKKGNAAEALALSFYGLLLDVGESYTPTWRVFSEALATSDALAPLLLDNGEVITNIQALNNDDVLITTERNIYIVKKNNDPVRLSTQLKPPYSAVLSASKNKLALCATDGSIELWGLDNRNALTSFKDYNSKAQLCRFSPDENAVICFNRRDKLIYKNIGTNKSVELSDGQSNIYDIQFNKNGSHFITRFANGTLGLYDKNGQLNKTLGKDEIYLHDAQFTDDGKSIISANTLGQVKLWNISKDDPVVIDKTEKAKKNVRYISNNKILYSSGHFLFIRNIENGKLENSVRIENKILKVQLNDKKTHCLVTTAGGNYLYFYDIGNNKINDNFRHTSPVASTEFSPDQKWIISADESGISKLWDLNGNVILNWISGAKNTPAVFSSSGEFIYLIAKNGKAVKKCPLPFLEFEKMKKQREEILLEIKEAHSYGLQYLDSF